MEHVQEVFKKIAIALPAIISISASHCYASCPAVTANPLGENITSHGAVANDGSDDTNAIYCAIEKAKTNSKKVIVPAGEFILSQAISMPNDFYNFVQIVGVGWASVIKHTGGTEAFTVGVSGGANNPTGVVFKDFWIKGETNTTANAAISFNNANNSLVSHMRFTGYSSSTAGTEGEGATAIKYRNTWVHTVENTDILGAYIGINALNSSGLVNALNIRSNDFESVHIGVLLSNVHSVNVRDNTIEGPSMKSGVSCSVGCNSINVSGNYFEAYGEQQVASNAVFIGNSGYNSGISINGNYADLINSDSYYEIRNARGIEVTANTMAINPNNNMSYIKLGGGDYTKYMHVNGNYAGPSNGVENWSGISFLQFVDPASGSLSSASTNYGVIFDNYVKKLFYGHLTTQQVYP